ncbi:MAG: N-acetyl-gamma-glutamyl-phosphate reductase, partial [Armatimonadetes bacterium]|nr:N-acetyl-gamma-glutamyl-phosphate reductase [Armatimonadota bacterium]
MIKVSVVGASGYTGGEIVRWLVRHPNVELVHLTAGQQTGKSIETVFPNLRGITTQTLEAADWAAIGRSSEIVFLALPNVLAMDVAADILAGGARIIDLGADFRLQDTEAFKKYYKAEHRAPALLAGAVYGVPEIERDRIRGARIVANPGCYATASVLGAWPLVRAGYVDGTIVIDGKSGVSGAGRGVSLGVHFSEVNENVKAYNVGVHRHQPEIEQALRANGHAPKVFFAPHLIPMTRGILADCYVTLARPLDAAAALSLYRDAYDGEPFVRVLTDELPQTKATLGSNFCDVTVRVDAERNVAVAIAAIDNLVKG